MIDYLNRIVNASLSLPEYKVLRSIDNQGRYWMTPTADIISVCRGQYRIKHFTNNGKGYYQTEIDGVKYYKHRLFAVAYNACRSKEELIESGVFEVHHLDRNRENNKLDNLCIITPEKHQAIHSIWRKIDTSEVIPWEDLKIE